VPHKARNRLAEVGPEVDEPTSECFLKRCEVGGVLPSAHEDCAVTRHDWLEDVGIGLEGAGPDHQDVRRGLESHLPIGALPVHEAGAARRLLAGRVLAHEGRNPQLRLAVEMTPKASERQDRPRPVLNRPGPSQLEIQIPAWGRRRRRPVLVRRGL
jgi:hypothetical protein